MCIIVGAHSKTGRNVSSIALGMLRTIINEFPCAIKTTLMLRDEYIESDSIEKIDESSLTASTSSIAVACLPAGHEPCVSTGDPKLSFAVVSGKIFNLPNAPASLIRRFGEDFGMTGSIELTANKLAQSLDGQYAFVLKWGDALLLARDMVGVKPLYLAENDSLVAFSSRLRPLWSLGFMNPTNLSQPTIIKNGRTKRVNTGMSVVSLRLDEQSLLGYLHVLLSDVITKMARQQKNKMAILFSGGLDSSVLAKTSKDLGIDCTLYCAGTVSSRDVENARNMASALDMPLIEKELTPDEIASQLLPLIGLVESSDMIAVSTSLPIYFAVRESASRGERVLLNGQGADELFGGYERYENTLLHQGYKALCDEMLNDVVRLGNVIPLYDHIGTMNQILLLAPFLDASILRFSLGVPVQLKLTRINKEVKRKYLLWKLASRMGIPLQHLPKQKVAAQFGSGVARIMDKISRSAGFTKAKAKAMGFPLPVQAYLREIGKSAGIPS